MTLSEGESHPLKAAGESDWSASLYPCILRSSHGNSSWLRYSGHNLINSQPGVLETC